MISRSLNTLKIRGERGGGNACIIFTAEGASAIKKKRGTRGFSECGGGEREEGGLLSFQPEGALA